MRPQATGRGNHRRDGRCRAGVPSGATTQAQRAEEARTSSLSSSDSPALSQPQRSPTHCPVPNTARQGYPPFGGVADARPGIPGELPAAPLVRYTYTEAGELLAVMTAAIRRCALSRMTRSTRADGGAPLRGKAGDALPLRRYGRVVEQLNPAGLSYRYLYEQDASPSPTA